MEAFSELKTPAFALDAPTIRQVLGQMAAADRDSTVADVRTRQYYRRHNPLVWVTRLGTDDRVDTLLNRLNALADEGFQPRDFGTEAISRDVLRLRTLDFDHDRNTVNHVMARLEYRLTKAFLRYAYGQRFGYFNPQYVLNRLDPQKVDSTGRSIGFKGLFDISIDLPSADYYQYALRQARPDSFLTYLRDIQPQAPYFLQLKQRLATATGSDERRLLMVNMERARWRQQKPMVTEGKRIIVNIPSFHLYAFSNDSSFEMRMACGAITTKTPQLVSQIEYLEVNPQWVIPQSIIDTDVARRAGDSAYFARNHYYIAERATGQQLPIDAVTRQMLLSGKYKVAQEGGPGNSLGRIIFRFPNNFSVFLHDTNNPGVFGRDVRGVSHGCVRVQRPFDLARFLLGDSDEWLLDRIRISMDIPPETEKGRQYLRQHQDEELHQLVKWQSVKPHVPIYIIYYTVYPDLEGQLRTYSDIYGFDKLIWRSLQPYIR